MTTVLSYAFSPEGDSALIIRLHSPQHSVPDIDSNLVAIKIAQAINAIRTSYPFLIEAIPTFNTVGVYYHPDKLNTDAFQYVCQILQPLCDKAIQHSSSNTFSSKTVEIPICYDEEFGIDLHELSQSLGISIDEIIALHSNTPVRVFMLGFSPGLPYLGLFNEKLNIPRRATPRVKLAAGSVAIANRQCVIYPYETPGGWHIVGRTPVRLFSPNRAPHTLYQPGDTVIFKPISKEEFIRIQQA